MSKTVFSQSHLEAIADALGDTAEGLTGSEIGHLLASCRMADPNPEMTKRRRLYNAFAHDQNQRQDRTRILGFIRGAMKPERFTQAPERFEPMRTNLNRALAFAGLCVDEGGALNAAEKVRTLSEAQRRAQELRADLTARGVHPDVLRFCKAELLADDYFHAVLEAVKSVADKIRSKTGLSDDGGTLIDRALSGSPPMLAVKSSRHGKSQERAERLRQSLEGHVRHVPQPHRSRGAHPLAHEQGGCRRSTLARVADPSPARRCAYAAEGLTMNCDASTTEGLMNED